MFYLLQFKSPTKIAVIIDKHTGLYDQIQKLFTCYQPKTQKKTATYVTVFLNTRLQFSFG